MFFTIEPMINLGRPHVKILGDGWTAVTRDRSLSAQFEHTVGVTETGCEVFTYSPRGLTTARRRGQAGGHGGAGAADPRARRIISAIASGCGALHGGRRRCAARLRAARASPVPRTIPRRDTKPLAKALLAAFGSFADVLAASPSG